MSLVLVQVTPHFRNTFAHFNAFTENLRSVVDQALSCEESLLEEASSIAILDYANDPYAEPSNRDVTLIVIAHDYPSRKMNLDYRNAVIRDWLRDKLRSSSQYYSGGSWILLAPSSYLPA